MPPHCSTAAAHSFSLYFLGFYISLSSLLRFFSFSIGKPEELSLATAEKKNISENMGIPIVSGGGGGGGEGLDMLSERAAKMRDSLQKSQSITENMVSILGSFDHRLSALETAMRPTQVGFLLNFAIWSSQDVFPLVNLFVRFFRR